MAKLNKDSTSPQHRVLVVGLSGAGKSTLVAELANEFPVIWISTENDRDVLTKLPQSALDNIDYINLPDSASYPIAVQTLMILFKNQRAEICVAHGKDKCALCKKSGDPVDIVDFTTMPPETIVVVDSITQLAASILAYTCKDKPVDYKPERDDWGALRKYSEFFASQFQAFPYNLVCTAHAVEAEMEDNKTKLVPSFGSKDMSSKIAKAFSDVVYIETKNKKHMAISSSTASSMILTKSRSDFAIELLDKPSLIPLFKNSAAAQTVKTPPPKVSENLQKQAVSPAQNAVAGLNSLLIGKKGT